MSYPAQLRSEQEVFACPHHSGRVQVESRVAVPSDFFQDLPVRILQRTCSNEFDCILLDRSACPMHIERIRQGIRH